MLTRTRETSNLGLYETKEENSRDQSRRDISYLLSNDSKERISREIRTLRDKSDILNHPSSQSESVRSSSRTRNLFVSDYLRDFSTEIMHNDKGIKDSCITSTSSFPKLLTNSEIGEHTKSKRDVRYRTKILGSLFDQLEGDYQQHLKQLKEQIEEARRSENIQPKEALTSNYRCLGCSHTESIMSKLKRSNRENDELRERLSTMQREYNDLLRRSKASEDKLRSENERIRSEYNRNLSEVEQRILELEKKRAKRRNEDIHHVGKENIPQHDF
eukprot:TRINITY_DN21927_c0_g1_i1.p1 TRINITY_DN21927_c0_g1~~TRINITY_DN21927_c0_g1_i1.p1  ORF type:complete len:273 (-),score=35.46 TRINITY_DN21927_c0_g1_i1:112-930(-)